MGTNLNDGLSPFDPLKQSAPAVFAALQGIERSELEPIIRRFGHMAAERMNVLRLCEESDDPTQLENELDAQYFALKARSEETGEETGWLEAFRRARAVSAYALSRT